MSRRMRGKPDAHELAEEIVRRVKAKGFDGQSLPYVIHLSDPPTAEEQLQLAACRLMGQPIAIVPVVCATIEEWLARYCPHMAILIIAGAFGLAPDLLSTCIGE